MNMKENNKKLIKEHLNLGKRRESMSQVIVEEATLQTLQRYVQEAQKKIKTHQAEQARLEAAESERRRRTLAESEAAVAEAERQHAAIARMFRQPLTPAETAAAQAELNAL